MTTQQTFTLFDNKQKKFSLIFSVYLFLIVTTVYIGFLYAQFQNSSFYLSESLLFSSYWLLFIPGLLLLQNKLNQNQYFFSGILKVGLSIVFHLVAYPALVWVLSKLFYPHTFSYPQTFKFGITNYLIATVLIYGSSFLFFNLLKSRFANTSTSKEKPLLKKEKFITSLLVSGPNNLKEIIDLESVLYILAKSPYISIHQLHKKYLHTATLKDLGVQLNNKQFIRVHKSCIVNLLKVVSYSSRLNGDYDLNLANGTCLRLSRHYAPAFKKNFDALHRVTTK